MEKADQELLMKLTTTNPQLKRLYQQHIKLGKEIERFEQYARYSSSAALKQRKLKKERLRGKESIIAILNDYRNDHHVVAA